MFRQVNGKNATNVYKDRIYPNPDYVKKFHVKFVSLSGFLHSLKQSLFSVLSFKLQYHKIMLFLPNKNEYNTSNINLF